MLQTKLLASFGGVVLVIIDHIIKMWALARLPYNQIEVIPGLFYLTYVENRGAAFGILYGSTQLLSVVTSILLAAMLFYVLTAKNLDRFTICIMMLIISGGVGNLLDRLIRGFVIDYLDFSALWNFPVFNFADCCVVIGCSWLIIIAFRSERKQNRTTIERNDI